MEAERTQEESFSLLTSLPARLGSASPVCDSTFLLLLRGPEAGAVRPPTASSSSAGWEQREAEQKRWAPFPRERAKKCKSQSQEAWTSFPTTGQGALPFPWAPLPSQTQPGLQHTVNVCTHSLSVTPHEGPQKTVRRNKGGLAGRSVCLLSCTGGGSSSGTLCLSTQRLQASCTPDSFLHSGLMLL